MTWFKVDDGFAFHPKAIMAGNAALGLWVRAGAWCGANLTDGFMPKSFITTLGAQKRDADKLVSSGLWFHAKRTQDARRTNIEPTPSPQAAISCKGSLDHSECGDFEGYQFHDWAEMQPSKADVYAERDKNKLRQKEWRDRRRNGVTDDVTDTVTDAVTNGAPTRPDPTHIEEAKASSVEIRDDVQHLCKILADLIEANGSNRPKITKTWTDSARRMIDLDRREFAKAENLIRWAQGNSFWRKNILSMPTFREKYDQLRLAALEDWEKNKTGESPNGEIDVDAVLGRDAWTPGRPPEGLGVKEEIEWKKQQRAAHIVDRLKEAKKKLGEAP